MIYLEKNYCFVLNINSLEKEIESWKAFKRGSILYYNIKKIERNRYGRK